MKGYLWVKRMIFSKELNMRVINIFIVIIMLGTFIIGCGEDENGNAVLNIQLKFAPEAKQQAEITRVVVIISGTDIDTQEVELKVDGRKATGFVAIPAGEGRTIQVKAYAGTNLEFEGEAFVDHPEPGTQIPLVIQLKPTSSQQEEKIFEIGNNGGTDNLPTSPTVFTLDKTYKITKIINYHWNYGQGATPGIVSLRDTNGKAYGPWQAFGTDGQGGVKNAYWNVTPNIELPAGTYTVIDSDPQTWAQNYESNGQGFVMIYGYSTNGGTSDNLEPVITGKDGMQMRLIPAGEFQMGSNDGEDNEKPIHTVYLDAFYIDIYEVTNAQYKVFMDATKHNPPLYWNDQNFNDPKQPVVGVSWNDATAYAKWAVKRLPTEAEWEKSARGGLVGKKYPWGDDVTHDNANDDGTGGKDVWEYTSPVGSFAPNGYGLYDIAGNAWEWCADFSDNNYYASSPKSNPTGPASGSYRVLRGGGWNDSFFAFRVASRTGLTPSKTLDYIGFRCVQ
jgi:sulfatase modifying factor 1